MNDVMKPILTTATVLVLAAPTVAQTYETRPALCFDNADWDYTNTYLTDDLPGQVALGAIHQSGDQFYYYQVTQRVNGQET